MQNLKFKSKLEKKAYDIISEIYSKTLFKIFLHYCIKFEDKSYEIDIAIPDLHLAFEIHGEQHRDKKHFFNLNKRQGFYTQKERDENLKEILEINNWRLIELFPEDITFEKIKTKIMGE